MIIGVVIPCYKVRKKILPVLENIGPEVSHIYTVDDACPDGSGDFIRENNKDPRVSVISLVKNQGVGGAVKAGLKAGIKDGCDILIKIDGDGQMDPRLIPRFVNPIKNGRADYTKGNRFFNPDDVKTMPKLRLFGNLGLSFLTKLSSGYWHIFDPTNGLVAIHANVARLLPLDKIDNRYFFESDMLFRLNIAGAKVLDIPMKAIYADEVSNLSPFLEMFRFFSLNMRNFHKRILYNYFLRDFNLASGNLILGTILIIFGFLFGINGWNESLRTGIPATAGTVMLAAMPSLMGVSMLISFMSFDLSIRQTEPIFPNLEGGSQVTPEDTSSP